jgi:hypothetical protein
MTNDNDESDPAQLESKIGRLQAELGRLSTQVSDLKATLNMPLEDRVRELTELEVYERVQKRLTAWVFRQLAILTVLLGAFGYAFIESRIDSFLETAQEATHKASFAAEQCEGQLGKVQNVLSDTSKSADQLASAIHDVDRLAKETEERQKTTEATATELESRFATLRRAVDDVRDETLQILMGRLRDVSIPLGDRIVAAESLCRRQELLPECVADVRGMLDSYNGGDESESLLHRQRFPSQLGQIIGRHDGDNGPTFLITLSLNGKHEFAASGAAGGFADSVAALTSEHLGVIEREMRAASVQGGGRLMADSPRWNNINRIMKLGMIEFADQDARDRAASILIQLLNYREAASGAIKAMREKQLFFDRLPQNARTRVLNALREKAASPDYEWRQDAKDAIAYLTT